jgi:hypothetical protein
VLDRVRVGQRDLPEITLRVGLFKDPVMHDVFQIGFRRWAFGDDNVRGGRDFSRI